MPVNPGSAFSAGRSPRCPGRTRYRCICERESACKSWKPLPNASASRPFERPIRLTMKRRSFFARILNALTVPAAASATVNTTPALVIADTAIPLPMADIEIPPWLRHWRSLSHQPVWESTNPTAAPLIHAAEQSQSLRLWYQGGTIPGESRLFSPSLVFRAGQSDPLYVNGWCQHRQAHRTLRLDQITLESPILL